jgi:sugar phosphate isomerase/epimerase
MRARRGAFGGRAAARPVRRVAGRWSTGALAGIGAETVLSCISGLNLALEPLGRNPLVPGPREAMTLIKLAGRANVGQILDSFHCYKSRRRSTRCRARRNCAATSRWRGSERPGWPARDRRRR